MKNFFQSGLFRLLAGTAVPLTLLFLTIPTALSALVNLAIACAIAGFGYLVRFVHLQLPDFNGAEPVELFGLSPAVFVAVQSLAMIAAALLLVSPFLVGLSLAAPLRRLLIGTSIAGIVLQAVCTGILLSQSHLTFTWNDQPENPVVRGLAVAAIYIALAWWGCLEQAAGRAAEPTPDGNRSRGSA
jgi:hypothetical protein